MKTSTIARVLFCVTLVSASFCVSSAQAVLLLDETFTYPDGSILGQNGGTTGTGSWTSAWTDSDDADGHFVMQSGELQSFAGGVTGAVERTFSSPASAGSTLYFAIDMEVVNNGEAGYSDYLEFLNGAVRMGVQNDSIQAHLGGQSGLLTPANPAFTGSFRLVSRLQFNQIGADEVLTFWIDPVSELDAAVATLQQNISALDLGTLLEFTQGGQESNVVQFDNFMLGTDFNFTPFVAPIPEPSSLLLVGGVLLLVGRRRKHARRS